MSDFFFFKQKTAYEMRISDWSSDVCSSDLCCRSTASTTSTRNSRTTTARSTTAWTAACPFSRRRSPERRSRPHKKKGHRKRWPKFREETPNGRSDDARRRPDAHMAISSAEIKDKIPGDYILG